MPPPDLWRHARSGALSCAYEGGERVFTWSPCQVADMARRWRDRRTNGLSERARAFLDAHHRIEILTSEAGLSPPDLVIHDFSSAELRAVWKDEDVVVVVERIGESASSQARPRVTKPGQRKV
jgi:hypothetical protein